MKYSTAEWRQICWLLWRMHVLGVIQEKTYWDACIREIAKGGCRDEI